MPKSKDLRLLSHRIDTKRDTLKTMQRGRLHLLLIPIAALIPILPLMVHGCSCGHDFDFHILNWLETARQFTHGDLHPQWAYTPAYNAGEPRFVFYPPLSWTLGALLGLLLPWTWTPIVYTWLVLTGAGLSMHRLARSFAGPTAALLASVFYLVNPYTLFTAYERTAYAELLAAVWIPLLLHAILRPNEEGGVTISRIALPVALLWLTNAPAAVMGCYALASLALVRLIFEDGQRVRLALNTILGTGLGLGLAAFYIVPAAYERRFVQIAMAILPGSRVQDNFIFQDTLRGLTDPAAIAEATLRGEVLRGASIIALILFGTTAAALAAAWRGAAKQERLELRSNLYALTTLGLVIALLLTPISAPIWLHAPELAFLQFPWRLLAILAAVLSLAIAIALTKLHLAPRTALASVFTIAATLGLPAYAVFHQSCDPEDTVVARVALFHSNIGSEPTDEYTPTVADNDSLAHANPSYWLSSDPDAAAPLNAKPGPAPHYLSIKSPVPQNLILNLRDYPAWHITLNSAPVVSRSERADGLIAIPISAGRSEIEITYAHTPDQVIGASISILSLACFAFAVQRRRLGAGTHQTPR